MSRNYKPFLRGELINLCVASELGIEDGWTDWFNDPETTRYLGQGVFPNTVAKQRDFLDALSGDARLALLICDDNNESLWGTISLSSIDWVARSAQISLVLPKSSKRPPLAALEAMARLTEHAFVTMGLERVWAGQAYPGLAKWNQRLELLGYHTEGILRRGFAKGRQTSDSVMISVLFEDYSRIKQSGEYWPGAKKIESMIRSLPSDALADRIAKAVRQEQEKYMLKIESLRRD